MRNWLKFILVTNFVVLLSACGGSSGDDGGDANSNLRLSISPDDIQFSAFTRFTPEPESVTGRVEGATNSTTVYVVIEFDEDSDVIVNATLNISGDTGELTIFPGNPLVLGPGTYNETVRVNVCLDRNCNSPISGSPKTVQVEYLVIYDPNVTDSDNDGVVDAEDAFPDNNGESADNDLDGFGDNSDSDDDNDGTPDIADALPLDETETLDTDGDLIGNNADNNDDGDSFADTDDPAPLDVSVPGTLTGFSPGFVLAGRTSRLLVTGSQLSDSDTFFVNGVETEATVLSPLGAEIELTADEPGMIEISIVYQEFPQVNSSVQVPAIDALYYPYAVLSVAGTKQKAYFDPFTESVFVHNSSQSQVARYKYVSGGSWTADSLDITNLKSIGMSRNNKTLVAMQHDPLNNAIVNGALIEIDTEDFSIGQSHPVSREPALSGALDGVEFDFRNVAVITTRFSLFSSSVNFLYDLYPDSATYGTQSILEFIFPSLGHLFWSAIASSGDGRMVLLGERGISPEQPLRVYSPLFETYEDAALEISYDSASIDMTGSLLLINKNRLYNGNFSSLGQLDLDTVQASELSKDGEFIVAVDGSNELHWFDTGDFSGPGMVASDHSVTLPADTGAIQELVVSDDGLTVFVLGENKMLVVPVWQIIEDDLGSAEVCPSLGCGDIPLADGVTP